MNEERVLLIGEFYKHFKDQLYQIREIAYDSENQDKMVVYQAMYGDFKVYVRPYDMFMSEVDHIKYPEINQKYRFEKVTMGSKEVETVISNKVKVYAEYDDEDQEGVADPRLLQFLDAKDYQDKLNVLTFLREKMDDRLINDIAISLDIIVEEGSMDRRYDSLRNCLLAHIKYECNRLR
ncbi:DUF1653 domain-containing protein [[Clostridium] fimetarium]|uniref:DUF1653 domain-containing protein n=1 Tax=[Clostridium] fimetarium TaxID=99656 RepID=A0A1I0MR01_9FIRM|nr:DUF1653 domain-containing protein [[Clostridium] fimetarium]SEV90231.1 Protein of unknown function [[Clostridium] fimetarium]